MLYDLRTCRCRPGTIGKQLGLYSELGFNAQRRPLGDPLFYGSVETGDVNAYVHLWQYRDAADRQARRAALYDDPDWFEYRTRGAGLGYQTEQRNTLLRPAALWTPPHQE
ncbi:NIPSNAP family protein [Tritonibacter mobilis]|uniref:NIPSNAP family containing protein n=1 Tax=Tritonibacter mobilis F1926 TaxID=1265309 RepID=A0A1B1A783_9RHOB|nr:NIPSNAP family protein [Tritonibacter mobilis]ANP42397.1 NIPSNAP family containing protein [Tritonibacter mobilis F1926]KJZ22683.1 NIPSNAP family containing protein [Tritonibacter mobilis]